MPIQDEDNIKCVGVIDGRHYYHDQRNNDFFY